MTVNWAALCTACGHPHHYPLPCSGRIQTGPKTRTDCPCKNHKEK